MSYRALRSLTAGHSTTIQPSGAYADATRVARRYSLRSYALAAIGLVLIAPRVDAQTFPSEFDLSSLASGDGSTGFVLNGVNADDTAGFRVSAAGDVNDDGIVDLLIGAPSATRPSQTEAGEAYLVYGRSGGFPSEFELSSLATGDGSDGFVIYGQSKPPNRRQGAFAGTSVSGGGDINGDGVDDLIVSAAGAFKTYVLFGRGASAPAFPAQLELASVDTGDGSTGFGFFGRETSGEPGDINNDGIDDLFATTPTEFTIAYVLYGRDAAAGGFPAEVDNNFFDPPNSNEGFQISYVEEFDDLGHASDTGDLNGDGIDDLILSSPRASAGNTNFGGRTHVLFGRDTATQGNFPIDLFAGSFGSSPTEGIRLFENGAGGSLGQSVNTGDLNGDGIEDLILGSPYADNGPRENVGAAYVVYGRDTMATGNAFPTAFELTSLASGGGSEGFVIYGVNEDDRVGEILSVGDFNGDGLDDIAIGNDVGRQGDVAKAYIVFGRDAAAGAFPATFELATLTVGDGSAGLEIKGIDRELVAGRTPIINNHQLSAGDLNSDGIDDLIVSVPNANPGGRIWAGKTYVVYGRSTATPTRPRLSIENSPSTFEGDYLRFRLKLSEPASRNVKFSIATRDVTAAAPFDYDEKLGRRTLAAGETERTIWVRTVDDVIGEGDETLELRLSRVNNAELGQAVAVGTITDNDVGEGPAILRVSDASAVEGGIARFEISLTKALQQDLTIVVRTIDGTATAQSRDYDRKIGTRTIPASETRKTIYVRIWEDRIAEGTENFRLRVNVRSEGAVIGDGVGIGTITDR